MLRVAIEPNFHFIPMYSLYYTPIQGLDQDIHCCNMINMFTHNVKFSQDTESFAHNISCLSKRVS